MDRQGKIGHDGEHIALQTKGLIQEDGLTVGQTYRDCRAVAGIDQLGTAEPWPSKR
jgi:hypothetical protein